MTISCDMCQLESWEIMYPSSAAIWKSKATMWPFKSDIYAYYKL